MSTAIDLMQFVPAIKGLLEEEGFVFKYEHKEYPIIIFSLESTGTWYEFDIDIEKRNNNEEQILLFLGKMERAWNEQDDEENKLEEICRVNIYDPDSLDEVRKVLTKIRNDSK